jgi:TRAP-type mannitol/chloroaromatic compound transport system permease small subunit
VLVTRTGILERERRVLYYLSREREKEVLDLVATLLDLVPHVTVLVWV